MRPLTVSSESEPVKRAHRQLEGARDALPLTYEPEPGAVIEADELREHAQARADSLLPLLGQTIGEGSGHAAALIERDIQRLAGELGVIHRYLRRDLRQPALSTAQFDRIAEKLQATEGESRGSGIAELNSALGGDDERLQRSRHDFAYHVAGAFTSPPEPTGASNADRSESPEHVRVSLTVSPPRPQRQFSTADVHGALVQLFHS